MSNVYKNKEILNFLCLRLDFDGIKRFLEQHPNLLNEALHTDTDDTLLMYACQNGWGELVECFISNYSDTLKVNIKNNLGETALHRSVVSGRIECIQLLLSHPNIDVNIPCGEFDKPVLWYCGDKKCYELLLPYYPTINEYEKKMTWVCSLLSCCQKVDVQEVKDIMKTIPLNVLHQGIICMMVLLAAERGHAEIFEYLLSFCSDIMDIQDQYGRTALFRAVRSGKEDCVKLLLASPNINLSILEQSELSEALSQAVRSHNTEILKALLDHPNINVNTRFDSDETALWTAVVHGRVDCLKLLLSRPDIDVNINYWFDKPVLWCCKNRECYDLLLPYYPTLNEYEKKMAWLWSECLFKGDVEEVKKLLNEFPESILRQMKNEFSVLIVLLVVYRKTNMIEYFLSSCGSIIDINLQDKYGNTALYVAVRKTRLEVIKLFLSQPDINVNVKTGEFEKPVLWYCYDRECYDLLLPHYHTLNEHEETMAWLWSLLLSYANDVEEVKSRMETIPRETLYQMKDEVSVLVLLAAEKGAAEILEYLLSSYSDVININKQDKFGRSSLHRAIVSNRGNCINILYKYKIDLGLRDKDGKTAFELEPNKFQRTSMRTKMNIFSMIVNRPKAKVKWNRCKIMLVGQGRAGKTSLANNLAGKWKGETPSTIGAEQMDMQLFYGGVQFGRLKEYERPKQEYEALLVEQSFLVGKRTMNTHDYANEDTVETPRNQVPKDSTQILSGKEVFESIMSEDEKYLPPHQANTDTTPSSSFNPHDYKIDLDAVDLHFRTLQEVNTPSSNKLILVDFGGQSIFNVLHGFFMSKHGIYLVVFDMELFMSKDAAKRESCRKEMKFWLNSITMYTSIGTEKTAPVAIVGTRGDKIITEEEHRRISKELKNMFEKMKAWQSLMWFERDGERLCFFPNDNTHIHGNAVSQELLRSIEKCLEKVETIKKEIPIFWIKIFDEMKELHRSSLPFKDVVKIAQQRLTEEGNRESDWEMIQMEVREMLRFLNDIGMLMWIEESDLEDVIILDPIEYLVKPATTIICKHLATKDDPYRTIHEIPEIHGESKLAHREDWMRMLEYGFVTEELVIDLLTRYYIKVSRQIDINHRIEKISQMMTKYGLMVPLFSCLPEVSSEKSTYRNLYFVPSLLPSAPSLHYCDEEDNDLNLLFRRLEVRYDTMLEDWNIGMQYSLFYFLPLDGLSVAKIANKSASYDIVSSSELATQGFLPHSLFERLICRFVQYIIGESDVNAVDQLLIDDELITGFQGKVQFFYKDHNIRMIERREENRIEVIIQSDDVNNCLSSADNEKEKEIFQEIHLKSLQVMEGLLRECYEGLLVETLIHLPLESTPSCNITSMEVKGFVTLERVRSLVSTYERLKPKKLKSYDVMCRVTLFSEEMKKDPYWSVWKEKVKIPTLPLSQPSSFLQFPLRTGKKTHVFLSHDWGIDGNNHNRVKQVSEALKSRGLITWIDDERIVNEIDEKIIDGIDHTECMLVFVTENYVNKLKGSDKSDYCLREFNYGCKVLRCERMLTVVLDASMKDAKNWRGLIPFNLGSTLFFDLTTIFDSSSPPSDKDVCEVMDKLYRKIRSKISD